MITAGPCGGLGRRVRSRDGEFFLFRPGSFQVFSFRGEEMSGRKLPEVPTLGTQGTGWVVGLKKSRQIPQISPKYRTFRSGLFFLHALCRGCSLRPTVQIPPFVRKKYLSGFADPGAPLVYDASTSCFAALCSPSFEPPASGPVPSAL